MEIFDFIKKYIAGILIVIFAICYALGWIDGETFLKLVGIFLGVGIAQITKVVEETKLAIKGKE